MNRREELEKEVEQLEEQTSELWQQQTVLYKELEQLRNQEILDLGLLRMVVWCCLRSRHSNNFKVYLEAEFSEDLTDALSKRADFYHETFHFEGFDLRIDDSDVTISTEGCTLAEVKELAEKLNLTVDYSSMKTLLEEAQTVVAELENLV